MEKPISKLAVVLLCLDVTAYHVAKNVQWNDWNLELHAQKFAQALMLGFYLTLYSIAGHFIDFGEYGFMRFFTLILVIEGIATFGFQKKITAIEAEYSKHYSPVIWIVFVVFMIVSVVYWFNSDIGHLPADYKGRF